MKVAYVLHYPGFGGANIACLRLAQELNNRFGITPLFLVPMQGPVIAEIEKAGFSYKILHYASWRGPRSGIKGLAYAIVTTCVNLIAAWRMKRSLSQESISIIHGNTSLCAFAWFLSKAMGLPLVWHQREFGEENYGLRYYYGKWIAGKIIGSSDAVLTVSKAMCEYYKTFVRPSEKVDVVYDGIEVRGVDEKAKEDVSIIGSEVAFKICMIGGISAGKNQQEVIKALACQDEDVRDMHFYMLGAGTAEYELKLKDMAIRLGVSERVHFLGHHANIWPYLKQMNCAVCASLREGFGLAVVESMYAGLPIVAVNSGSMPELVVQGKTGYIYEPGDVDALSRCLVRVKEGQLGVMQPQLSRSRVLERFTSEKNADAIMRIYCAVLDKAGNRSTN